MNGVKQGGVLCPVLFCLLIDGLLDRLAESKIGCNFHDSTSQLLIS